MPQKQSYEELEKRIKDLEKEKSDLKTVLHESKQKFNTLIQNIEDGYYEVDLAGNFILFNKSLCKILGYSKKELTGLNNRRYMDEENAKIVFKMFNRVYKTGHPYKAFDWELIKKGGSTCYIEASVALKRDSKGQPIGFQGIARDITERKQAEDEFLREKRFSEILINKLPGSFYMFTESGHMMRWNENLGKVTGYSSEEIQQMNALDFFVEEEKEKVYQRIQEVFVTGVSQVEANFLHRDGHKIPHVLTGSKVEYNGVPYLLGVGLDITERKQVEIALKESEERFRQIAENIREVFWLFDWEEQRVLYVSPAYELIWGRSSEGLIESYDDWGASIHPDDVNHAQESFNLILDTGGGEPREYRIVRPDGSQRWISDTGYAIKDEDGKVVRIVGIAEDITERKRTGEALQKSEAKYRLLADNIHDNIWILDIDSLSYSYVSPSSYKITGYSADEVMKLQLQDVLTSSSMELATKVLSEELSAERQNADPSRFRTLELELNHKDGSTVWTEVSMRFIYDEEGQPKSIMGVTRDISQSKQAAKALRESEEKLARSKKMESLGLLAGGVAHDLNNILSGIVSYPELILMDLPEDSKFRKSIEAIQESGNRAAAIVQDLITVARGVAITREPLNLNDLVDDYLYSPEFDQLKHFYTTITVKTNLDTGLFNINGSHVHVRKVLMNLVQNAVEAVQSSGHVTISTINRYLDRPLSGYDDVNSGEYVVLSVSDDGPGILSDDLERIFEPFYTKKVMGRSGTGLGLAVVWNVILDHKGYIDVISDENGTIFELYFPITRKEVSDEEFSMSINDYKGNGETILVVDDVESQRDISCKMLEILGYQTKAVSSGEKAVEYLKVHSVDLLVLDMIMDPGINGRETFERIIEIYPKQKAIIVSGFAVTEDVKATQKLGAGKYIKKPYTIEKIGLAVKEELGK